MRFSPLFTLHSIFLNTQQRRKQRGVPIYAIVSIGKGWEFGKLDGNVIYKHPIGLGLDNPHKLLGVLDFIFADCVRTAEKFDMY